MFVAYILQDSDILCDNCYCAALQFTVIVVKGCDFCIELQCRDIQQATCGPDAIQFPISVMSREK